MRLAAVGSSFQSPKTERSNARAMNPAIAFDRSIFGDWKLLPTAANRMPAAASYLRRGNSDRYVPFKLDVLRTGGGLIAEITTFDASLFDRFGLPPSLPATAGL